MYFVFSSLLGCFAPNGRRLSIFVVIYVEAITSFYKINSFVFVTLVVKTYNFSTEFPRFNEKVNCQTMSILKFLNLRKDCCLQILFYLW